MIVSVPLQHKGTERFLLVCAAVFAVNTCTYYFHVIYTEAKHTENHIYIFMSPAAHINFLPFTLRNQVKAIYIHTEHVQGNSKDSRTNTYTHWSFLHVFTKLREFNDKKYLSSKRARTCHFLCKRSGSYRSATKIHLTDKIFQLTPIHASLNSLKLFLHLGKTPLERMHNLHLSIMAFT